LRSASIDTCVPQRATVSLDRSLELDFPARISRCNAHTREDRSFPYAISSRFYLEPIFLQKSSLSALVMRRPADSLKRLFYWVRGSPHNFSLLAWRAVVVCFHLSPILNCTSDISSHLRFRQGRSCSKREQSFAWPSCHAGSLKPGGSRRGCAHYREKSSRMPSISLAVSLASPRTCQTLEKSVPF
jgi:hypothetical protein